MEKIKRKYGAKYKLVFNPNTQCYDVLEWLRGSYPLTQGYSIMTFTEEGILDEIFKEAEL